MDRRMLFEHALDPQISYFLYQYKELLWYSFGSTMYSCYSMAPKPQSPTSMFAPKSRSTVMSEGFCRGKHESAGQTESVASSTPQIRRRKCGRLVLCSCMVRWAETEICRTQICRRNPIVAPLAHYFPRESNVVSTAGLLPAF